MSPTVDYPGDTESSSNVPSIPLNNIVDFYSSGAYRTPEIHRQDNPTWSMHRHSGAQREPQNESAGVHVVEYSSLNPGLAAPRKQHDESPPFYHKPDSSTYASRVRRFTNLKDNLSATSRNPCAEILKKIRPRVEYLYEVALEEEGQEPLSSDSYLGLVSFLNGIPTLSLIPVLVLTYEGNIVAEWRRSPDEKLVLQFLDSFNLKFVFFYTDSYDPTKILRISGNGSALSFFEDHPRTLSFLKGFSD